VAWLLEKREKRCGGKPGKRDPFPLSQREITRELCGCMRKTENTLCRDGSGLGKIIRQSRRGFCSGQ